MNNTLGTTQEYVCNIEQYRQLQLLYIFSAPSPPCVQTIQLSSSSCIFYFIFLSSESGHIELELETATNAVLVLHFFSSLLSLSPLVDVHKNDTLYSFGITTMAVAAVFSTRTLCG